MILLQSNIDQEFRKYCEKNFIPEILGGIVMTYIPANKTGMLNNQNSRFENINSLYESIQIVNDAKTRRIMAVEFEH